MLTLEEAKKAVVEDFSMYDEWLDKYEYLIELGKNLEPYPEEDKTDDKLIKGCQSRVWLDSKVEEGKVFFKADSDAIREYIEKTGDLSYGEIGERGTRLSIK